MAGDGADDRPAARTAEGVPVVFGEDGQPLPAAGLDLRGSRGVLVNTGPGTAIQENYFAPPAPTPREDSTTGQQVEALLSGLQVPTTLQGLVARAKARRWVSVAGPAGSGKSTLLAALCRPRRCEGLVPKDFVHAAVFLNRTSTGPWLAQEVAGQLRDSVPGYGDAQAACRDADPASWDQLDPLEQSLTLPLTRLGPGTEVRLVFDGLDQLEEAFAPDIRMPLVALATTAGLEHVHVIAGLREIDDAGDWLPDGAGTLTVGPPNPTVLARYLQARRVRPDVAEQLAQVCARGESAWLLARLLADTFHRLGPDTQLQVLRDLGTGTGRARLLTELFDHDLDAVAVDHPDTGDWHTRLRPVLTPLAAAGPGPVMPWAFLCAIAARFGGPTDPDQVRDTLNTLGRFIVRVHPGTDRELVGLFHPALAEHLARHTRREVDVTTAHRILLEEINRLTPISGIYTDNPLYRWAADAEAEHWWHLEDTERVLTSLLRRNLPTPREELARWNLWHDRFHTKLGARHWHTLAARGNSARWAAECGDSAGALALLRQLLPDLEAVIGPRHPSTLTARNNIADWTGECGDSAGALELHRRLLPDREAVLGPRHPDTLTTRSNIAAWAGGCGDSAGALELHRRLLPDREAVLGPRHPDTLTTRGHIAAGVGGCGDSAGALELHRRLLPDRGAVLGPRHPHTLATRGSIAAGVGECGDSAGALELFRQLLPDEEAVLGPRHPDTLSTRHNIAHWTGQCGDGAGALELYRQLLPDREAVLGPRHPHTLTTRGQLEHWQEKVVGHGVTHPRDADGEEAQPETS